MLATKNKHFALVSSAIMFDIMLLVVKLEKKEPKAF